MKMILVAVAVLGLVAQAGIVNPPGGGGGNTTVLVSSNNWILGPTILRGTNQITRVPTNDTDLARGAAINALLGAYWTATNITHGDVLLLPGGMTYDLGTQTASDDSTHCFPALENLTNISIVGVGGRATIRITQSTPEWFHYAFSGQNTTNLMLENVGIVADYYGDAPSNMCYALVLSGALDPTVRNCHLEMGIYVGPTNYGRSKTLAMSTGMNGCLFDNCTIKTIAPSNGSMAYHIGAHDSGLVTWRNCSFDGTNVEHTVGGDISRYIGCFGGPTNQLNGIYANAATVQAAGGGYQPHILAPGAASVSDAAVVSYTANDVAAEAGNSAYNTLKLTKDSAYADWSLLPDATATGIVFGCNFSMNKGNATNASETLIFQLIVGASSVSNGVLGSTLVSRYITNSVPTNSWGRLTVTNSFSCPATQVPTTLWLYRTSGTLNVSNYVKSVWMKYLGAGSGL
jgi:hypothetical protein